MTDFDVFKGLVLTDTPSGGIGPLPYVRRVIRQYGELMAAHPFNDAEAGLLLDAAYARWADRGPVAVAWEPRTAHLVLAALQRFCTDPDTDVPGIMRLAIERAGRQLQELVADDDHIRALLEQGWNR